MSIIIACGSEYRKLTVPGEKKFLGYGVSYCATCDIRRNLLRQIAAVIGDGATAVMSAFKYVQEVGDRVTNKYSYLLIIGGSVIYE